jgi:xanthine dehydrogenase YagT iron-sulfur-binding subunit
MAESKKPNGKQTDGEPDRATTSRSKSKTGTRTGPQVSRRGFLTTLGASALASTVLGPAAAGPATEIKSPEELLNITLAINGRPRRLLVEARVTLLDVLRSTLGLTATKIGCGRGECGACTVLVGEVPRYSCMTLAVETEGHAVTTLEGLMQGEELTSVQQAFAEADAYQCGFCTPGQIIAVEGLLRHTPDPELHEIQTGVSGNLCRCGAYRNIFEAARRAAELR